MCLQWLLLVHLVTEVGSLVLLFFAFVLLLERGHFHFCHKPPSGAYFAFSPSAEFNQATGKQWVVLPLFIVNIS